MNQRLLFPSRKNELGWCIRQLWRCSFSPIVLKLGCIPVEILSVGEVGRTLGHQRNHSILEVFFPVGLLEQNFNILQSRGSVRFPCLYYCLGLLLTQDFSLKTFYFDLSVHDFP